MDKKQMTVKEILNDVCEILGEIEIPASKLEKIGIPIARSINGLRMCIDAIDKEEAEAKKNEQTTESDSDIEIVEVGQI